MRLRDAPLWQWPNLLSLDAPVVALAWQDFLVRSEPHPLPVAARWALGLAVWCIYLADRWLDARRTPAANETARHRFYRQNRVPAALALAVILVADGMLAMLALPGPVLRGGMVLGLAVAAYLGVFSATGMGRNAKHVAAAALFSGGVFLAPWMESTARQRALVWPAIGLALVCLGNMWLVERWESGLEGGGAWIGLAVLAGSSLVYGPTRWFTGVGLSAGALAVLDVGGKRLPVEVRVVLADLSLLTPCVL